jgi:hypothetical protein
MTIIYIYGLCVHLNEVDRMEWIYIYTWGFLKWGTTKSPWVSILKWSHDLDDLGMPMILNTSICISISILIYMYVGSCGHLSFFFSNIGCQKNISMGILGTEAASGCAETWRIVSRPVLLDSAWGLSASKWLRLRHLRKQRCSLGPRDTHGYLIIISIYIYIYNIYI